MYNWKPISAAHQGAGPSLARPAPISTTPAQTPMPGPGDATLKHILRTGEVLWADVTGSGQAVLPSGGKLVVVGNSAERGWHQVRIVDTDALTVEILPGTSQQTPTASVDPWYDSLPELAWAAGSPSVLDGGNATMTGDRHRKVFLAFIGGLVVGAIIVVLFP